MYKITNTTKKPGHETGPHKKGWFIGLEQNHIISPDGHAYTQELTPGLLDLRQQGLISIDQLDSHQILPVATPIPPKVVAPIDELTTPTANVSAFAEPADEEAAVYAGKKPNYIVTATPEKQGTTPAKPRAAFANVSKNKTRAEVGENFS